MLAVRRRCALVAVAILGALVLAGLSAAGPEARVVQAREGGAAFRAFYADSWWNTPVPPNAPKSPIERQILDYMRTAPDAGGGCLKLAGTGSNQWGQPVFWAGPGDTAFDVSVSDISSRHPELASLRMPKGARAAATSDAAMTVFDRERGYVTALTGATFDAGSNRWSARGATVTYLASNGLHARTKRSDNRQNFGSHRGNNGATMMVRYGEVEAGAIRHVLKVASGPETSRRFVFPMVGSDGDSSNPVAPRQGLRFRIKPSVDIETLGLSPQATVIAKALQQYGMYLGDNAGHTTLKLQDTRASGRGKPWQLNSTALCSLPFSSRYWDVIKGGYDPSR